MILLAIILIGAGLACLGFVAYSILKAPAHGRAPAPAASGPAAHIPATASPGNQAAFAGRARNQAEPSRRPVPAAEPGIPGESAAPRTKVVSPPVPDYADEADGEDAPCAPLMDSPASAGLGASAREDLNFLRDRLTGLQRIDPDSLNEALRVFEKTERETPEAAPQLVVTGVLFLDHGRKIPGQLGRRGEIPTRVFSELRRVGNGTLILENSSFLIHCGNTSYSYSAGDMDQILFQGSGLALVPIHPDRPIPVFLTTEVEAVKAYIKKNARIRAL